VRWAADINYNLTVVSDACSDPDAEVHRVLTEKIYPRQGAVITADEFLRAVGSG
jgi:nicotinamidase-related amidase